MKLALFTIKEAAERLKCSESSVRRLLADKRLGCHRGPKILVSELHIQEYLDATEDKRQSAMEAPAAKRKAKKPVNRLRHINLNNHN